MLLELTAGTGFRQESGETLVLPFDIGSADTLVRNAAVLAASRVDIEYLRRRGRFSCFALMRTGVSALR